MRTERLEPKKSCALMRTITSHDRISRFSLSLSDAPDKIRKNADNIEFYWPISVFLLWFGRKIDSWGCITLFWQIRPRSVSFMRLLDERYCGLKLVKKLSAFCEQTLHFHNQVISPEMPMPICALELNPPSSGTGNEKKKKKRFTDLVFSISTRVQHANMYKHSYLYTQ